jgi:co-chaperonin GroES (HSP10)
LEHDLEDVVGRIFVRSRKTLLEQPTQKDIKVVEQSINNQTETKEVKVQESKPTEDKDTQCLRVSIGDLIKMKLKDRSK